MNVSVSWLEALLGRRIDPAEAAHRLSMTAVPVDAVEPVHQELGEVVVGLVEHVDKHPNADRLSLCRVHDGTEVREVVCGAPNVTAGARYPYAPAGSTLPGGFKLEKRKIRGVLSNGMLCSAKELGLGHDHQGIMLLATDAAPGTPLLDVLPVADTRLILDVTPNRPDLLGHRGVARELGAGYGVPAKLPAIPGAPSDVEAPRRAGAAGSADGLDVVIEDAGGCPRYAAAVIRGVTVGPSPAWLQARLLAIGARPINNVVDATNYLLFELNQPMHAFDLARLRGGRIVVRCARPGERLTTLDGERRSLSPQMTLICDADGPIAIGGVMGGADSEVTGDTTDVVLECAYFDPKRIRNTRKALKMSTEASYRFERGTDPHAIPEAVRRGVTLIRAVAAGAERESAVDVCPTALPARTVFLRPERVEHLLGVPVPPREIEELLASVGFTAAPKNGRLATQVPGWRPDVTREVDLIEEVARLRGYDTFATELRPFRPSCVPDDPAERLKGRVRRVLTGMGLHEARSLPLVPDGGPDAVALVNPLSSEEGYLRRSLLTGLVRAVERNWAARERDVRLFEIGVVFEKGGAGGAGGGLPVERLRVAAVVTGGRAPAHWTASGRAPDYDMWDVKDMFETLVRLCGPPGQVGADGEGWVLADAEGRRRGRAGTLHADRPAWGAMLYGFELDVESREVPAIGVAPVPSTPPVERDLALVLPERVAAANVEELLRAAGGDLLERVTVFDEYRNPSLAGRSVAWHLTFRAPDRTLRDEEVDAAMARIVGQLKERLGVEQRRET